MEESKAFTSTPIVEAVVDIDCDIPQGFNLSNPQPFLEVWGGQYPLVQAVHGQQIRLEAGMKGQVSHEFAVGILAQQFRTAEGNPVLQARQAGFSFNRLKPYSNLDDYLGEIRRCWECYRQVVKPLVIRSVRLKYINRLMLPMEGSRLELEDYFKVCPSLPQGADLDFLGFFHQHTALERSTGHTAEIVLMAQPPESGYLPVIFDITVTAAETTEPENWAWILEKIQRLRTLKQSIFENTLTEKCLKPYHS
jgi:uncharacterized protein (TIGR04255 family)